MIIDLNAVYKEANGQITLTKSVLVKVDFEKLNLSYQDGL